MNRQQEIALRANLHRYLSELSSVFGRPVEKEELLSVEDTASLQEASRRLKQPAAWRVDMPFSDRLGPRFRSLLVGLEAKNPSPVYVWIDDAQVCGVPRPVPLSAVRLDFEFAAIPGGIVSISSSDLADDLVLDFSNDDDGSEMLTIEVSGPRWGTVSF